MSMDAQNREKYTTAAGAAQALDIKGLRDADFLVFDERTEQIFGLPGKMHNGAGLANPGGEMVK